MEEVEAALLENRIGWLAETVVDNLLNDQLEEWIRHVGLAGHTEKLISEIERVKGVVTDVKVRAIGNRLLTRSLGRLREVLYDADDAVDELDYYRLQQQVQGDEWRGPPDAHTEQPTGNTGITVTLQEGTDGAEQVDESNGDTVMSASNTADNSRSFVWQHFHRITDAQAKCKYCDKTMKCPTKNGTNSLIRHYNSKACNEKRGATEQHHTLSSADEGASNDISAPIGSSVGRGSMRINGASTPHETANTHPWKELSHKIQHMTHHLHQILNEVMRLRRSASSNQSRQSTTPAANATSCFFEPKLYGRDAEIEFIKSLIMSNKSNGITVLPIVGIGGIGKTTLSQRVYNDPEIENQFEIKIWVHVSDKFDVVRITREILESVSNHRYKRIKDLNMLQQDLAKHMKSKKFLVVLDDIWDVTTNGCWDTLLGPLRPNHVNPSQVEVTGNTIIVTTRIRTVAKSCGTVGLINLEALEDDDIWQLLKASAFGNNSPDSYPTLQVLGKQIVRELNGNPMAAKTVGRLFQRNLNIDNWNSIIKNKEWQSLQHIDGIMYALKLSYAHLPTHLQQCFSYCSLFPKGYSFSEAQLIHIWIAQGFVEKSSEKLERKGWEYLAELVDFGFFQQAESMRSSSKDFVMHDLMHDLARMVSQTECATIDGSECRELAPSIRHLKIVTDSAYCKDQNGNISRNVEFEKRLLKVKSRNKLRTLVLIGQYDFHFLKSFKDAFKELQHLRLLQITSTYADFDHFLSSLVNSTHLRYLKLENKESHVTLPQALSKCYHLQVLDIGSCGTPNIPEDINNLVSLRHLVAKKRVCSFIANIGKMNSIQELDNFIVQNSSGFEVKQMKSMNKLVQLRLSRLENITSREESCRASLREKQNLEKLCLSWKGAMLQGEYHSDESCDNEYDSDESYDNEYDSDMISEPSMDTEKGERLPIIDIDGSQSLEHSPDIASEVLEGLEPHHDLKHLWIFEYNGSTSPTWLASSLTCLQSLHLENCGKWQRLPLERLPLLIKLVLIKMGNATEVSIPSLEELVLIELPSLNTCSCTSVRNLNSSLKVLKIRNCPALEVFPLFENCQKIEIERTSWLSHLSKLTIYNCPLLCVHNPLPPSSIVSKLLIDKVSTLPTVVGSSSGTLTIGQDPYDSDYTFDKDSDQLKTLDNKVLSFHNLRFLTGLTIYGCRNLATISLKSLRQLVCLKSLELYNCPELLSSNVPQELTREYMSGANHSALPSLERLHIEDCGITGKWLSLMLQHAQALQELSLDDCKRITGLLIGEEENSQPNLMSATEAPSLEYLGGHELVCLPLNLVSSLKKLSITQCDDLTFYGSKEDFAGFFSLEELVMWRCPELLSSLTHNDGNDEQSNGRWFLPLSLRELEIGCVDSLKTLQPCFPGNITRLKKLEVFENPSLTSLQLHSCTALQELIIQSCESLNSLEGLQWLGNLRLLRAHRCLSGYGEYGRCILPQSLEELYIREYSQEILQPCFEMNLTCLKRLEVSGTASFLSLELQSCTALEHLKIEGCASLATLESLQFLHALRHLEVFRCPSLPPYWKSLSGQGYELCPRLERLKIDDPSILTTSFSKHLNSLQCLELNSCRIEVARLTDEQERALQLLTSLQELQFGACQNLIDLPTGLHSLPSLKRLEIWWCKRIARLPEKGLPPSLEELDIDDYSEELAQQCRTLASKLKVKINGTYVN